MRGVSGRFSVTAEQVDRVPEMPRVPTRMPVVRSLCARAPAGLHGAGCRGSQRQGTCELLRLVRAPRQGPCGPRSSVRGDPCGTGWTIRSRSPVARWSCRLPARDARQPVPAKTEVKHRYGNTGYLRQTRKTGIWRMGRYRPPFHFQST